MQKIIQLTREGFDKIKKELDELKNSKRPQTVDALQKARSMGDLSENTAYSAAREELALVEGRIQEIEEILKSAQLVANGVNNGQVALGSTVTVQTDNNQEQIQIVGEFEADPKKKRLSHSSPLGKGLLGKKVGDQVTIDVPAGKVAYKIIAVK